MNVLRAKELLHSLRHRIDVKQPLDQQVSKLFVPALFGNEIHFTDSWRGRISLIFNFRKTKASNLPAIKKSLAGALKAIEKDRQAAAEFSLSYRVSLESFVHENDQLETPTSTNLLPGLAPIDRATQEATLKHETQQREAVQQSLLRNLPSPSEPISVETFNETIKSDTNSPAFIELFKKFLQKHPEFAHKRINDNLANLEFAKKFNKSVESRLFPKDSPIPLTPEQMQAEMFDVAENMALITEEMQPGKSWMVCGGYGSQLSATETFSAMAKKVPNALLKELPPVVAHSLKHGNLPDPTALVDNLLQQFSQEVRNKLPEALPVLHHRFVSALLQDDSRELTGRLAESMPKVVKKGLESWYQQGLIGDVMELVEDGETRDFILWIAEKGARLRNQPDSREEVVRDIEEQMKLWVHNPASGVTKRLNDGILDFLQFLPSKLPYSLQQIMGIDTLFSSGKLWLDIGKQPDGQYTLLIYASGPALHFHRQDITGTRIQWPIRIKDIPKEKLNKDFFYTLLRHQYGHKVDANFLSKIEDIYQGFLNSSYLGGVEGPQPTDAAGMDTPKSEEWSGDWRSLQTHVTENEMRQLLMTAHDKPQLLAFFEMRLEALLALCHANLRGPQRDLVIEDEGVCAALEKAVGVIEKDMLALADKLEKARTDKLQATLKEIQAAIDTYHTKNQPAPTELPPLAKKLPPAVVTLAAKAFQNNRSSLEQLQSFKATLCWALGDEFGDLIDALTDAVGHLPQPKASESATAKTEPAQEDVVLETPKKASKGAPQGWLRTILFNTYFRLALSGLNIAITMARVYRAGFSILVQPYISQAALIYLIPQFIQDWYAALMGVLFRRMAEITCNLILRTLFSKEDAEQIQAVAATWRNHSTQIVHGFMGTQALNFTLDKPATIPPKEGELFQLQPFVPSSEGPTATKQEPEKIHSHPSFCETPFTIDPEPISTANLVSSLESWVQQAKVLEKEVADWFYHSECGVVQQSVIDQKNVRPLVQQHVVSQASKLQIPERGKRDYWDEVENPEQCLELVSDLALALVSTNFHFTEYQVPKADFGKVIISYYSLLAIIDKLARRCPEARLKEQQINAYSLLSWVRRRGIAQIDDRFFLERLEQIRNYFMPDIDLNQLPDENELARLARKTLFDAGSANFLGKFTGSSNNTFIPVEGAFSHEITYLKECLEKPEVQANLRNMGVDLNKVYEKEKYEILLAESSVFTRGKSAVIPRPYALLRYHTHMGHNLCFVNEGYAGSGTRTNFYNKSESWEQWRNASASSSHVFVPHFKNIKNEEPPSHTPEKRSIWQMVRNWEFNRAIDFFQKNSTIPEVTGLNKALSQEFYGNRKEPIHTQSEVMEFTHRTADFRAFLSIPCETPDETIRATAYFREHKADLINESINHITGFRAFAQYLFSPFNHKNKLQEPSKTAHTNLSKQLQESPQVAFALGDLFTELLEALPSGGFSENYFAIVSFGLRVQKHCQQYAPEQMGSWPDFRKFMKKSLDGQLTNMPAFYMVYLETFNDPEKLTDEERLDAATALLRGVFLQNKRNEVVHEKPYIDAFRLKFLHWTPTLRSMLEQPATRQKLIQSVLQSLDIPVTSSSEWKPVPGKKLVYACDAVQIDFLNGFVTTSGVKNPNQDQLDQVQKTARSLCPNPTQLHLVTKNIFETTDKTFRYEYRGPKTPPRCTRIVDGKTYLHLSDSRIHKTELLHSLVPNAKNYWVEVTNRPEKNLIVFDVAGNKHLFTVRFNKKGTSATLLKHYTNDQPLAQIPSATLKWQLMPLQRFCPPSEMVCLARQGENRLAKVEMPASNLSFDIKEVDGDLRAYSIEFPGFYLAPQQNSVATHLPAALILVNQQGDKKVIMKRGQWLFSALQPFLETFGHFSHQINSYITEQMKNGATATKQECYAYNLEPSGDLTSDDPEALAYLLSMTLLQRNTEAAEKICERFELLCKRQPIPQTILNQLYPLFIPAGIDGIKSIRQRVLAALEENRQVNIPAKKPKVKLNDDESGSQDFENLVTLSSLLYDLYNRTTDPNPRRRLTDYQEWLLYRRLFFCARNLFTSKLGDGKSLPWITRQLDTESLIESLALPEPISAHYRALKARFGKKESNKLRAARIAGRVLKAPSSIPKVPLTGPMLGTGEGCITEVASIVALQRSHKMNGMRMQDIATAIKEADAKINPNPPLTVETISRQAFLKGFLTYYKIARGEGPKGQKEKLQKLFPLLKGGWDPMTNQLLNYLELVCAMPRLFRKTKKLEEIHKLLQENTKPPQKPKGHGSIMNFLGHLERRLHWYNMATAGGSFVGKLWTDGRISQLVTKETPVLNVLPVPSLLQPVLHWGSKLYNAYKADASIAPLQGKAPPTHVPKTAKSPFAHFEIVDKQVDGLLERVFASTFEEVHLAQQGEVKASSASFEMTNDEPIERDSVIRLNNSIKDFNARPDRQPTFLRLRTEEDLWSLYLQLAASKDQLKRAVEQDKKQLLDSLNALNVKTNKSVRVKMEDLYRFFLDGDVTGLSDLSGLPASAFSTLDRLVGGIIVRSTRLQQLERAVTQVEILSQIDPNQKKEEYEKRVEQLADILKARRAYNLETPSRLLRRLMLFELHSKKMLWKKQLAPMQKVLLGKQGNAVLELLMGFGKTDVIAPIIDSHEADGQQVVFNIWPTSMLGANVRQISTPSKKIFDQIVNVLRFHRNGDFTPENLATIQLLIERAQERNETIHMTKEDAKAIELIFLDLLDRQLSTNRLEQAEELIEQFGSILRTMRSHGKAVGDEAHELYNDTEELNYPVGPRMIIKPKIYQMIESCMRHLTARPEFLALFRSANAEGLEKLFNEQIAPDIAEKMSTHWKLNIKTDEQRQEFQEFVLGKAKKVPSWIFQSEQYSEIAMVKGLLTVLLPLILERRESVDYGPSLAGNGKYARPYKGNRVCLEQSTIRDPYEAAVKTALMLMRKGIGETDAHYVRMYLVQKLEQEVRVRGVAPQDTNIQKLFETMSGTKLRLDKRWEWTADEREAVDKGMSQHPDAILLHMRHRIWKSMHYWPESLRSDAQNFGSLFASRYDLTGTPYNDGVYPEDTEVLWDPGTQGEALHILNEKCPKDGIHVLRESQPESILDEVLKDFFKTGTNFTALIDGGAQLQGMDNLVVAKKMAEYAARHRPDIKAINFFMLDKHGLDQQMTWEVGATKAIPYDHCTVPLSQQLTYFDHVHGFAANFPQKFDGKGMVLLGPNHMLYRLLQEAFRMRGLKEFKKLLTGEISKKEWDALNLQQTQTIHFAMTESTRKMITKENRAPTLEEIISFARQNEKVMALRNYNTYRRRVHNMVRNAVMKKLLVSNNKVRTFAAARDIVISHLEDDPKKLYGLIDKWIPTEQALEATKAHAIDEARKTGLLSDAEIQQLEIDLQFLRKGPMPKEVHVYTDGEDIHTHLLDQLSQEMHQENEIENETETEQELESELNQQAQNQENDGVGFTEWGWPEKLNARSVEWMKFQNPDKKWSLSIVNKVSTVVQTVKGLFKKKNEIPPLFRLADLVTKAKLPIMNKISILVDKRLWVTNNFMPRVMGSIDDNPAEVGSYQQRELNEVLVHFNEIDDGSIEIESVGCLSQRDAAQWRNYLAAKEQGEKASTSLRRKVVLWDPTLRAPVAGDKVDLKAIRQNKDLLEMETQLKFLNGDINYRKEYVSYLRDWILKGKIDTMEELFHSIHSRRRNPKDFAGSDLDTLFADLKKVPLTERF